MPPLYPCSDTQMGCRGVPGGVTQPPSLAPANLLATSQRINERE